MVDNCVIYYEIYNYAKQSLGEAYLRCSDIKSNVIRNGGFSLSSRNLFQIRIQDM